MDYAGLSLFLCPFFLYFYHLIHDKTKTIKNLLIRIMLLGSTLFFSYVAYEDKIDLYVSPIPFLLFIALCLIKKYPINNPYTKHMLWIYLVFLVGLALLYVQTTYIAQTKIIGYIFLFPLFLSIGLVLYWMVDYVIYLKSRFGKHDVLCLLWCLSWGKFFGFYFFKPIVVRPDDIMLLYGYYFSFFSVTILAIIIFFYHSFYFIILIFFKNLFRKSKKRH